MKKDHLHPPDPFPCPFCHSSRVALVGGGLVFLHYQCQDCAEGWTAMAAVRPAYPARTPANSSSVLDAQIPVVPGKKIWLN